MLSSLRARLLLWYTLILALVIATFAATLGYLFWRSLVDDIDQRLQASSAALVEGLRPTPWGDFDLVIPLEYRVPDANTSPDTYYAVWNNDGELIDRSTSEFEVLSPAGTGIATREGRRRLEAETASWRRYSDAVAKALATATPNP